MSRPRRTTHLMVRRGTVLGGKVELEGLMRRGGMGSVWRGRHLTLDVAVAVKFLPEGRVDEVRQRRFAREAQVAAQIRSSNVVQVLDHGVDRGLPYIIMELLDGEDLSELLRRRGRLSLDETAFIVRHVARGLAQAHQAGLVHRDLKPGNIFLAREGDDIVPKILDFGVAKRLVTEVAAESEATQEGMLLGTPYYMSPEQARGDPQLDHRTDIWALGVVIYRALLGRRPFPAKAIGEVILQIATAPIVPPSAHPDLPPALDDFMARALCRDVDGRFQSATELAAALDAIAATDDHGVVTARLIESAPVPSDLPSGAASAPPSQSDAAFGHPSGPSQSGGGHPSTQPSSQGAPVDASLAASAMPRREPSRALYGVGAVLLLVLIAGTAWFVGRTSAPSASSPASAPAPVPQPPERDLPTRSESIGSVVAAPVDSADDSDERPPPAPTGAHGTPPTAPPPPSVTAKEPPDRPPPSGRDPGY